MLKNFDSNTRDILAGLTYIDSQDEEDDEEEQRQ